MAQHAHRCQRCKVRYECRKQFCRNDSLYRRFYCTACLVWYKANTTPTFPKQSHPEVR